MSDKTMRLVIDLTYDPEVMHGDCEDAIKWFNGILYGDYLELGEFYEFGDLFGSVKVIKELTGETNE